MYKEKICVKCGDSFIPKSPKQQCCRKTIVVPCIVCGKPVEQICTTKRQPTTCSKKCSIEAGNISRSAFAHNLKKICKYCGKEFIPESARTEYCTDQHYAICEVCGKQFEVDPKVYRINKTCSEECRYILANQNKDLDVMKEHLKSTILDKYGVENIMFLDKYKDKIKSTNIEKYGAEFYTQTQNYKDSVRETCLKKYGVEHHLASPEIIAKRTQTCETKYGAKNVLASSYGKAKTKATMLENYGVINPSQNAELKRKATKSAKCSTLESRIGAMLTQYNIQFERHYHISDGMLHHEFDFYLPKYKILIDADGVYFHSYLTDPDGVRVRDDYDDVRLAIIPKDHILHIIVETQLDHGVKQLVDIINRMDAGVFNYESDLFQWCRTMNFPYPQYDIQRRNKDYKSLCKYIPSDVYNPNCRIGESIVQTAHKSLYSAHCGNKPSPVEGWYNDGLLKKVILNRLIYINDVNPSKILRGLYISKLAPRVSIFNPVLARYLTLKYLSDFSEVFDPFSGYSGRLLGVVSTGKYYLGQDINSTTVSEANTIITDMNLLNCEVTVADILDSSGRYDCLLTCPPYDQKEIYGDERVFKSCDDWIDECLSRFKCNRYVFVVDKTVKYASYVVETISTSSHLNKVNEYIIVI